MRSVPLLAVSLWLGAMGFFALVVAPAAFATLDRDAAGRLVSLVFPRYYQVGVVLGVLALAGCVVRARTGGGSVAGWISLALVLLMVALTLYAWAVVLPAAHAAREAMRASGGETAALAARFARLHRLSGLLNAVVMIAGVACLAVEVIRRP
jgi:uncharacterized membrane protein